MTVYDWLAHAEKDEENEKGKLCVILKYDFHYIFLSLRLLELFFWKRGVWVGISKFSPV